MILTRESIGCWRSSLGVLNNDYDTSKLHQQTAIIANYLLRDKFSSAH